MYKKKLIICFHPYSYLGGATISLSQLLNGMDKKKFEIVYLYIKKDNSLDLNKNIKTIKIKSTRVLLSIIQVRKILSRYNNKKFIKKIYISNQNFSNIFTTFILKDFSNYKSVLIERNHLDELDYYESIKDFFKKNIIKNIMKLNYSKASLIIGNARKLSKDLSAFVNKKIKTIYSPTNSYKIIKLSKSYVPSIIKKDTSRTRLLSVSRFTKRKDVLTLLEAFNSLSNKYKNIDLILIGYGPELNNINKFVKDNKLSNRVFVLPPKKNPFPFFRISDLYIMTSLYEGCPNSIVEATMLNLPVISSNCNSGPSEILLNGRGGTFYKKRNVFSLMKKISLFMDNKKIFEKKLKVAKNNIYRFEEKRILKQYNNLFNSL
jgi:glycosyltransferase involved in cell wall biosynthesis